MTLWTWGASAEEEEAKAAAAAEAAEGAAGVASLASTRLLLRNGSSPLPCTLEALIRTGRGGGRVDEGEGCCDGSEQKEQMG
jgi:hypothetical protein